MSAKQQEVEENLASVPDKNGHFGIYGGRFVAETLMTPLKDLEQAYHECKNDPSFQKEFYDDLANYVGRPSPLYHAKRLSELWGLSLIHI